MRSLEHVVGDYLVDMVTGEVHDSESFDDQWDDWMIRYGAAHALRPVSAHYSLGQRASDMEKFMSTPDGRRWLGQKDPMMFILIYLKNSIRNKRGEITFSDLHFIAFRDAWTWQYTPMELAARFGEDAPYQWVAVGAPRESGKTHLYAKLLPFWAMAYGYIHFMIFAGDKSDEAISHVKWWKAQLTTNALFLADFPDRSGANCRIKDTQIIISGKHGKTLFRLNTAGVDGALRGTIDVDQRPDYIVVDDIDAKKPGEIPERRRVLTSSITYLGDDARIRLAGTNTMPGNIMDDLLADVQGRKPKPWTRPWDSIWIQPIVRSKSGGWRSWWIRTREYSQKIAGVRSLEWRRDNDPGWYTEMENKAIKNVGALYQMSKIRRFATTDPMQEEFKQFPKVWIEVDPAYTIGEDSDETGICIAGRAYGTAPDGSDEVGILYTDGVKKLQFDLASHLGALIDAAPWHAKPQAVFIEMNGMGDNWLPVMSGLGVPVYVFPAIKNKEARLERAAIHYNYGRVLHLGHQSCEDQQLSYDGKDSIPHVDQMDVVSNAILRVFEPQMLGYPRDVPRGVQRIGGGFK